LQFGGPLLAALGKHRRLTVKVALGIDTGGTYTDAVLLDQESTELIANAKALTTYHDLSIGIGQAVKAVLDQSGLSPDDITMVALSTTLATNALVVGRGSPVCLILIGYDPDLIREYGFDRSLVTDNVIYVSGGHDGEGNEQAPLDETTIRQAVTAQRDRVEAFAVSGYFGVRNPDHELRAKALIEELTGQPDGSSLPVTCGHELTTGLNAVHRATTTVLNARLIPLLKDLIATVRRTLDTSGVTAPLMVVRGDGSLVRTKWAMERPIETILSGPAASVMGGWHLAGRRDALVVDMGGTTTDIAILRDGRPRLNQRGAQVGKWRTMIEAVDVHTVGLGGDSLVSPTNDSKLSIGPRRVIPLCLLASEYPAIKDQLQNAASSRLNSIGQFILAINPSQVRGLNATELDLIDRLAGGPLSVNELLYSMRLGALLARRLESLETRRLVLRAGFTPTDALHVLGRFERWDVEASRLGADSLAGYLDCSPAEMCEQVINQVSNRISQEVIGKVLADEAAPFDWNQELVGEALLARAQGLAPGSDLACQLTLQKPLVAIGAPVEAYLPQVARQLHTEKVIPDHAGVANAIGAAVGSVILQLRVNISQLNAGERYRVHLPDGVHDFPTLEAGIEHAEQVSMTHLKNLAHQAGTDQYEVQINREDKLAPINPEWGQYIYLGTELTFMAVGRPSPATNHEWAFKSA
jgi:N-methylhydantoinase A/oxoprolinase/acetone carboxylase beta subunit